MRDATRPIRGAFLLLVAAAIAFVAWKALGLSREGGGLSLSTKAAPADSLSDGDSLTGAQPPPSSVARSGPALPPRYPYAPPIDPPHQITSSFGEFRRNHFHGGVDFSTSQSTGRDVHAADDGWVWRVRASGSGYGRSLYCRLADGNTVVYAHLEAYAPHITSYVEAAQESLGRYEVDLYPTEGRLPFHRGDIIALTGQSGAGPPHLHYEVRSGSDANLGVNPLEGALAVEDTIPPLISWIRLEPYGAGSHVEGPSNWKFGAVGGPIEYRLAATPVITGAAIPTLRTYDPSGAGDRLGVYRARLSVDGDRLYEVTFGRFDWEETHQVDLAFNEEDSRRGDNFVLNLYRPPGSSDHAFGDYPPLAGILSIRGENALSPGVHDAVIEVADARGNTVRLSFPFEMRPVDEPMIVDRPAEGEAYPKPIGKRTLGLHLGRGPVLVFVNAPVTLPESAAVTLRTPLGSRTGLLLLSGRSRAQLKSVLPLPEGSYSGMEYSVRIGNRSAGTVQLDDVAVVARGPEATFRWGRFTLEAPRHAFFGPGALVYQEVPHGSEPNLSPVGSRVELKTQDIVLDKAVTISIRPPDGSTDHVGLYRLTDNGTWDWLGNEQGANGISGETRYLTSFALFRDVTPPVIGTFRPSQGAATGSRPDLFAGLSDDGSGFSWRNIEATIDSVPQIVAYDPESGTLSGRSRRELAPGSHVWSVRVTDRAGNVAERSASFRVR